MCFEIRIWFMKSEYGFCIINTFVYRNPYSYYEKQICIIHKTICVFANPHLLIEISIWFLIKKGNLCFEIYIQVMKTAYGFCLQNQIWFSKTKFGFQNPHYLKIKGDLKGKGEPLFS